MPVPLFGRHKIGGDDSPMRRIFVASHQCLEIFCESTQILRVIQLS